MENLKEVLAFIKNADTLQMVEIQHIVDVRKSEIRDVVKNSFRVGDKVGINHNDLYLHYEKVTKNDLFTIIKINNKNIKVQKINGGGGKIGGFTNVSPSLLVKK
jgi:hypothetical protein